MNLSNIYIYIVDQNSNNELWSFSLKEHMWNIIFKPPDPEGEYTGEIKYPGSRYGSAMWIDKTNKRLFMYGGQSYISGNRLFFIYI